VDENGELPTGFDVEAVTTWLAEKVPDLAPPLRWTKLAGGHSNFTYRIDDAAGSCCRRPTTWAASSA
jgi:hypothetical protein